MTPAMILIFKSFGIAVAMVLVIGVYALITTDNLIRALIALGIMTKAVTLLIILAGYVSGNTSLAQVYVISIIIVEVVLAVVAGGIIISIHRKHGTTDISILRNLKG
jgi:NADH:ubiquinone oxidoreductase subunit K